MNSIEFGNRKFFTRAVLLSVVTAFFGCGGGENTNVQEDSNSIWYFPDDPPSYLSIDTNNEITVYQCSLSDGFVEDTSASGYRDADNLFIYFEERVEPFQYQIIESESSYLVLDDPQLPYTQFPFEVVSEISTFCNSNIVEIVDVSPAEAVEGVETVFTVSFNYRLINEEQAVVEMGFTSSLGGSYTIPQQEPVEVFSPGDGSGALTVSRVPFLPESGMPYFVHVDLSPAARNGPYVPFATDQVPITIIEN